MFKWERKLIEFIDQHLLILAFLMVTLLTLYMRRAGYWYVSFDFESHFNSELPQYLHTPFYTFLLGKFPAISVPPIRQLKILICLFDFCVASGAIQLLKYKENISKTSLFACYTLLLVSPLTIEAGLLWIHPDSICMSAFLWALVLYKRKHSVAAGILLGIATAVFTPYAALFFILAFYGWKKTEKTAVFLCTGIITTILLNAVSIAILGLDLQKGIFMLINWLIRDPKNGAPFSNLLPWLKAMPAYWGYMIGTLLLITAFWKPKYRVPATVIHVILFLYIGHILQYGW